MALAASTSKILSSRFPTIAAALKKIEGQASAISINSELATMWAQAQIKAPRANVMYIVSGLGQHVLSLMPKIDASASVVVYESSFQRLQATLETDYWNELLSDPRFHLFAGPWNVNEFERLHGMPIVRISEVIPLRFSPIWQTDEKVYAEFFAEFARQFDAVRRLHLTNFNDSFFWQATSITNLKHHSRAPDVSALQNLFPEIPAILVGAGPSLDEAEGFLKAIKDRALIIATNSSYRKLRNIGVKPHLVVAADPREDTARGFENQPTTDGCFLVAPFIVNPRVTQLFEGNAFSWSGNNNFLIQILRKRLGLSEGTTILEKGTVSLAVADLTAWMGVRRLILIGQDMAIRSDGQTHTSDSFYGGYQLPANQLKTRQEAPGEGVTRMVPGNTFSQVPTLDNLFVYLKAFEQWVLSHPKMEVINTSRLGAKIDGAPYASYEQSIEWIPQMTGHIEHRLREAFDKAPERQILPEAWREALQPTLSYARKLYDTSLTAAVMLEALQERYFQPSYKDHKEIREIHEQADAVNRLIEKSREDYMILIEGRLKKTLLDFQLQSSLLEASQPYAQDLIKNREFFWALAEGAEPTLSMLEKTLEPASTTLLSA